MSRVSHVLPVLLMASVIPVVPNLYYVQVKMGLYLELYDSCGICMFHWWLDSAHTWNMDPEPQ